MNSKFLFFHLSFLVILTCLFLSGCAFHAPHNKSILDIRNEAATNYSQQVLDSVAGVYERAELPLLFSVEAGSSTWTPSLTGTIGGQIPFGGTRQIFVPTLSKTESLTNAIQYNDFGSAPMTRVNTLFSFLCFPFQLNTQNFPNGSLHTIVDIADSKESFIISTQLNDGRYLGVTRDKQISFMKFVNDVMFWTRHDQPDPRDLQSHPGIFFKISNEFSSRMNTAIEAVQVRNKIQPTISKTQEALTQKQKEYDAFLETAINSKQNDPILKTIIDHKYEELTKIKDGLRGSLGELEQVELDLRQNITKLFILLSELEILINTISENDPDVVATDTKMSTDTFRKQLINLADGDEETIRQLKAAFPEAGAAGLKAEESLDDLYRERFESLPQQTNQNLRGTQ